MRIDGAGHHAGHHQEAARPSAAVARPAVVAAQELRAVQASRQTSTDLTIVTADGDRVTLSARSSAQIAYADYRAVGLASGQQAAAAARAVQVSQSQSVELTVEGNLSKAELHDIKRLVKELGKVARDFLRGEIEHAAERAQRLDRPDSIAQFDLSVERRETVAVLSQQSLQVA